MQNEKFGIIISAGSLGFLVLQKVYFCHELDIRVPKLVEVENEAIV